MATLSVQKPVLAGTTITYGACAGGGDQFTNTGKEFILIKNGDASPHTITVASPTQCSQGSTHNVAVVVSAGAELSIGPFASARFNDINGFAQLTYSAVTSVTIAIVSQT